MAIPAVTPSLVNASSTSTSDNPLTQLSQLLSSRAEIFAGPSSSFSRELKTADTESNELDDSRTQIYDRTLNVAKTLFDDSLRQESQSLTALAQLYTEIRAPDSAFRSVETRSKKANRSVQATPSRKNSIAVLQAQNPTFQQTPIQELYLGDSGSSSGSTTLDNDIAQRMVWEQLELRVGKILGLYKEIVQDGDEDVSEGSVEGGVGDSSEEDEDVDDDEEEMMDSEDIDEEEEDRMMAMLNGEDIPDDGMEEDEEDEEDEDEDMEEEDEISDDGQPSQTARPEPYFAKLQDASSPVINDKNSKKASTSTSLPNGKKSKGKDKEKAKEPTTTAGSSSLDKGFFSLSDFHSQMRAGEDEMRRYMGTGKSKSIADLNGGRGLPADDEDEEDAHDDENEEIDYFVPARDAGAEDSEGEDDEDEDEDEEDEEGGATRPEDMRYSDFWNEPKQLYSGVPGSRLSEDGAVSSHVAHKGQKGKGKGKQLHQARSEQPSTESSTEKQASRRSVSFNDAVKVQEFDDPSANRKTAIASLVKQVGMKEALKRIAKGEVDADEEDLRALGEEDVEDDDEEGEDEEDEMDEDDEAEEEEEDESVESDDDGADAETRQMRRVQTDLFADEDEQALVKKDKAAQSRQEARLAAISEQIAELEAENVAEREWNMRGEANSRSRPINSLLEEDLEFDQVAKVVPVVTEESSLSLEDLIKKRILDDQFDDVVRRRPIEQAAYLPSRLLDVKTTKEDRSLAEIYADEFASERNRAAGETAEVPEIDAKLEKEHESIRTIFDELCNKLDALSNARFTPKAASTTITTLSNAPSISLESALPTAQSTSTLLAPEEVYAPSKSGTLTSKSEMTPSQKKAERAKVRKARAITQKAIEKYGGGNPNKRKESAQTQKDRAMNSLIGKRGVTVVGKGKAAKSALTGKERKDRGAPASDTQSGKALKL